VAEGSGGVRSACGTAPTPRAGRVAGTGSGTSSTSVVMNRAWTAVLGGRQASRNSRPQRVRYTPLSNRYVSTEPVVTCRATEPVVVA